MYVYRNKETKSLRKESLSIWPTHDDYKNILLKWLASSRTSPPPTTNPMPLEFNNHCCKKNISAQKSTRRDQIIPATHWIKEFHQWLKETNAEGDERLCCPVIGVFNVTSSNLLKYFHLSHDSQDCLNPRCHSAEAPSWVSTLFLWLQMGKWKTWGFAHSHKDQMMPSVCLC